MKAIVHTCRWVDSKSIERYAADSEADFESESAECISGVNGTRAAGKKDAQVKLASANFKAKREAWKIKCRPSEWPASTQFAGVVFGVVGVPDENDTSSMCRKRGYAKGGRAPFSVSVTFW